MTTLKNILISMFAIILIFACDSPDQEIVPGIDQEENFGSRWHKRHHKKIVPFYAKLVTSMTPTDEKGNCEAPFDFFNNQEGEGRIAPFGQFTTKITFCVNFSTLEYKDGIGTLFFENGDELYLMVSGQILPSEDPDYDLEFHDKFFFTGGTGRFEGASGWGRTYSFVHLFPEGGDQTDHEWMGVLILPKKRHGL